jgi:ribosomal-protein-alanine N-acetyltransferase
MRIRTGQPDDIDEILKLERDTEEAAHWSQSQYVAILSTSGPRRHVVIVEDGGLRGFLVARADGDEWEIENIAVAESARRLGFGSQLLEELIQRARAAKASSIFLEVRESNRAARALYEKWGFQETGRRRRYYREPDEDALTYCFSFV